MSPSAVRTMRSSSFTGLSAILPNWALEGTPEERRKRLLLPDVRRKVREELDATHPDGKYLDRVMIAQTFSEDTHQYEGLIVSEAARRENRDAMEFLLDLLAREESEPTAIYHSMNEENMYRILKYPQTVIGSDSASRAPGPPLGLGKPHPRAYGCFPRFLQMVREKKFISIEEAIKKMTGETAKIAGLDKRGLLKPGYFADVVVFDQDKITDQATYEDPHRFATGISCVIVNGKVAVRDDEVTGERNGRILKRL